MFGFRVNPPDPVGDVGPNHYVEMINLVFAVYSKTGSLLLGPVDTGTLWAGFPVEDCTDPSGDPIVVYDQFADRWLLSQFTTAAGRSDAALLQLRRDLADGRSDRRVLPVRVHQHRRVNFFPTTRSTGSGRTRTSSRPASSARPSSTESGSTPSTATR